MTENRDQGSRWKAESKAAEERSKQGLRGHVQNQKPQECRQQGRVDRLWLCGQMWRRGEAGGVEMVNRPR